MRAAERSSSAEVTGAGSDGYRAARSGLAALDRSSRARLALRGRAPEQVLVGLISGKVPGPLSTRAPGIQVGRAEGSALLTPKGRMVAELRVLRGGPDAADGFLLDVPAECREAALAHLKKFVPPRLAILTDESDSTALLTVLGPLASDWISRSLPGVQLAADQLTALVEGDLLRAATEGGDVTILRTADVAATAFDLLGPGALVRALGEACLHAGALPLDSVDWEVLRVEAGRPAFGFDLDETTIPVEAGIHARVVDYTKGCFTGQEVLVRIRDRGHVNRLLRGLRIGQAPPPPHDTALFREGEEKPVGHVTSAVRSPLFGEAIGLCYVRREVEPPTEIRLGSSSGTPVRVVDLETDWKP